MEKKLEELKKNDDDAKFVLGKGLVKNKVYKDIDENHVQIDVVNSRTGLTVTQNRVVN